jgi:hypothetical protein
MHYACIINALGDGRSGCAVNSSSHLPAPGAFARESGMTGILRRRIGFLGLSV